MSRSWRGWNKWSLRRKLLVFYLPFFVLPSVAGLAILAQSYNAATKENATAYSRTIVNLTADKLNATIAAYNDLSLQLLTSSEVAATLSTPASNEFEKLEIQRELEQKVLPIIGGIDDERVMGAVFDMPYGSFVIGKDPGEAPGADDLRETLARNGAPYWSSGAIVSGESGEVRTFRLSRVWKDDNFRPVGTYYLVINADVIRGILDSAMSGAQSRFELAGGDRLLLGERQDAPVASASELKQTRSLGVNDWTLNAYFASHSLYGTVYRMSSFAAWLAVACVLLGIVASQVIRSDVAVPIAKLMTNMRLGLKGNSPRTLHKFKGAREIVELNDTFISVMYEIYNLIGEAKQSEARKREAQLKALRNQLSPHFLYNTLNSIRWMAMIRKQDHIREMVDALSSLLRYSIRETDELVVLEEELNILRDFVKIQQVRYQNFAFVVELDEEVRECLLLKLLLQPIVENAIVHGLSSIGHAGEIRIEAGRAAGSLRVLISDNGAGISAERLTRLREQIRNGDETGHIGLSNVKERIELHYGSPYGLEIESRPGEGTTVELRLPLLKKGGGGTNA